MQQPDAVPTAVDVTLGQAAVPLYGPWKFTIGDSPIDAKTAQPLWAEPGFDDSRWETVDLTPREGAVDPLGGQSGYVPGWTARGHADTPGYAWYRIRVRCHVEGSGPPALAGPADLDDAYQAFADGKLLGSFGDFSRKRPTVYFEQPFRFRLSESCGQAGTAGVNPVQVLAFRFWMEPQTLLNTPDAGGMHTAPVLGEASVIELHYQLQWLELIRSNLLTPIEAGVFALFAAVVFSLILFDRSDPVYVWIGLLFLAEAFRLGWTTVASWTLWIPIRLDSVVTGATAAVLYVLWGMVWWVWFGRVGLRRLPWVLGGLAVLFVVSRILAREVFLGLVSHAVALRLYILNEWLRFADFGLMVWIVILGIRRKGIEGWLALPVILMLGFALISTDLIRLHLLRGWFPFGVAIGPSDILDTAVAVVIALLLLRRLLQSIQRQREMALDVKHAQEVQQVILPERRIALPGFVIETEYRAAREVGGDFFQIIPHASDGSVMIVAGDVTGKGLKAGMLVALLVGAVRTEERHGTDPVVMLRTLNQRLMGRGDAQATCLALRISADGEVTLANAGHVAPYLNGDELPMEGTLPLGLFEGAEPSVMHFQLEPNDRLVLMSDGIAEATDANGHLFGFDRVHELLSTARSAAELAGAAEAFGQEDDISVITVTRERLATPSFA